MKRHVVVHVIGGEVPEEQSVTFAWAHLNLRLREISLASFINVGEIHQNSSNPLSSASNEVHAISITSEPISVGLVLLAILVSKQVEDFSVFDGQEGPLRDSL